MKLPTLPYPQYAMIQTHSLCSSGCVFCPYPVVKDDLEHGFMDEALFQRIVDDLAGIPQIKRLLLYLMNEPLMDKHIVEKINYAKERLPWTTLHVISNGASLTPKLSHELIASKLDWIGFSVHGIADDTYHNVTKRKDFPRIKAQILDFINTAREAGKRIDDYVLVNITRAKEFLHEGEVAEAFRFWKEHGVSRIEYFEEPISRAGNVEALRKPLKKKVNGCNSIWATEMLHILYSGQVVPCCMDWSREEILGDLKQERALDVWNGERYNTFRRKLFGFEESADTFICKRCEASNTMDENATTVPSFPYGQPVREDTLHNLINRLQVERCDEFVIQDGEWLEHPHLIAKFLDLLRAYNVRDKKFVLTARAHGNLSPEILKDLRSFGLSRLVHDGGSCSNRAITLRKHPTTQYAFGQVLDTAAGLGITNDIVLELFFPGEAEQDFKESVAFIAAHKAACNGVINLKPFGFSRDSDYYRNPGAYGIVLIDDAFLEGWHYQGYNNHSYRRKKVNEFQIVLNYLGIKYKSNVLKLLERNSAQMEESVVRRLVGSYEPKASAVSSPSAV